MEATAITCRILPGYLVAALWRVGPTSLGLGPADFLSDSNPLNHGSLQLCFRRYRFIYNFIKIYVYFNNITLIILRKNTDIIVINQSTNLVEIELWLSYRRIQQDQPWQPYISARYRANALHPLPPDSVYPSWFAYGFRNGDEDAATMSRQSIPRSWIEGMIQVEGTTALRSEGKALTRPLLVVSPTLA